MSYCKVYRQRATYSFGHLLERLRLDVDRRDSLHLFVMCFERRLLQRNCCKIPQL